MLVTPEGIQDNGIVAPGYLKPWHVSITRQDGGLFSLLSFDAMGWRNTSVFDVTGIHADGSTVVLPCTSLLVGWGTFVPFVFDSSWANLAALRFDCTYKYSNWYYIDNLVVEAVPEPATLSLLAMGGLLIARRRRA